MQIETFPDSAAAAAAAAEAIARRLSGAGERRLMITGGRGVAAVYDRLSGVDLGWGRVVVTLSDERFVDPDSPDSNERQARERLLTGSAAAARFVPLKGPGPTPADDARAAEPMIRPLVPFDAALLGMGDDGHIGSIFPGSPDHGATLDPEGEPYVIGVEVAGLAPFVPRISLAGRALLGADLTLLLVAGEAKRALLGRVAADPAFAPPVAALVRRPGSRVRVLWSPS